MDFDLLVIGNGKQAFKTVSRARAMGETHGFVKFVVNAKTDALLGMHVLSHSAAGRSVQGILLLNTPDRSIAPMANCIWVCMRLCPKE